MIDAYDASARGWVQGRGRRARWRDLPFDGRPKDLEPQYLLPIEAMAEFDPDHERPKLGFMAIASATNRRSMVACALLDAPCGNSVPTLRGVDALDELRILAVLDSFVFDHVLRLRMGGINLNRHVLAETPVLTPERRTTWLTPTALRIAASLAWTDPRRDRRALRGTALCGTIPSLDPESRRRRRAILDAVVAHAFGLDCEMFAWVLRDTQHDVARLRERSFTRTLDPKGFWRIDSRLPIEQRLTTRALREFEKLERSLGEGLTAETAIARCLDGSRKISTTPNDRAQSTP